MTINFSSGILQKVSYNWTNIIANVEIYTDHFKDHLILSQGLNWSPVFQYPLCQTLNIEKYFDLNKYTPKEIMFNLEGFENLGVTLNIVEKNKILTRTLKTNFLAYEGPSLEIFDLFEENHTQIEVIFKMSQVIKTEKDPESQCKNYPHENYLNYNDCDQSYIQKYLQEEIGITPFWATQNLDSVTKLRQILFTDKVEFNLIF